MYFYGHSSAKIYSPAISSIPNLQEHSLMQALFFVSMPMTVFLSYSFCSSFSQNSTLADWLRIIWLPQVVFPKRLLPSTNGSLFYLLNDRGSMWIKEIIYQIMRQRKRYSGLKLNFISLALVCVPPPAITHCL